MPRLAQLRAALLLGICMASQRAEPAQPVLTITAGADNYCRGRSPGFVRQLRCYYGGV